MGSPPPPLYSPSCLQPTARREGVGIAIKTEPLLGDQEGMFPKIGAGRGVVEGLCVRRAVRTREDFWNANGRLKGSSLPFAIVPRAQEECCNSCLPPKSIEVQMGVVRAYVFGCCLLSSR